MFYYRYSPRFALIRPFSMKTSFMKAEGGNLCPVLLAIKWMALQKNGGTVKNSGTRAQYVHSRLTFKLFSAPTVGIG